MYETYERIIYEYLRTTFLYIFKSTWLECLRETGLSNIIALAISFHLIRPFSPSWFSKRACRKVTTSFRERGAKEYKS